MINEAKNLLKKSKKENDENSTNLKLEFEKFRKTEKECEALEEQFSKFGSKVTKWRRKLEKWSFVQESDWSLWETSDFIKFV